jgi:hypothetical protein
MVSVVLTCSAIITAMLLLASINTVTLAIIPACIAAMGSCVAALLARGNQKKIREVHVLVNDRLDNVIRALKIRTTERDDLLNQREHDKDETAAVLADTDTDPHHHK